jgi:hypothetical protein
MMKLNWSVGLLLAALVTSGCDQMPGKGCSSIAGNWCNIFARSCNPLPTMWLHGSGRKLC